MLTNYLPDDVLQYVVNEYMSHHPDDIDSVQRCVRGGFVFNLRKYVQSIRTEHPHNGPYCYSELYKVDGYTAKYEYYVGNQIKQSGFYKYDKPHGRFTQWDLDDNTHQIVFDGIYVMGTIVQIIEVN